MTNEADESIRSDLQHRFLQLQQTPISQLEQPYIPGWLHPLLDKLRGSVGFESDRKVAEEFPAIESLDSAVLMFGGLNIDIGEPDLRRLLGFLAERQGGRDSAALSRLVENPKSEPWVRPYEEGYRLAGDCRDELGIEPDRMYVDMDAALAELDIEVSEDGLETDAIRGAAVASSGFAPAILVNRTSFYNNNEAGRRFTLAHELCHILYDRTRAKKLSHLSGPWVPAHTEKRANAFAAMFLAPPSAIRGRFTKIEPDAIRTLAGAVGMGVTALIEHLYNIDLIDDNDREKLRQSWN